MPCGLPVNMIGKKRNIQQQGEPFASEEEENIEEDMQEVLGENKRVQTGALVNRVLVVSPQLVKSNYLKSK